jgi:IS30 family transposase
MKYRTRIYYTDKQKGEMWDRWQKGETLHSIARLFDRHHTSVRGILAATGGIRPPERCRSQLALTLAEREEISRGIARDQSLRAIAARLKRAPSTISREVNRNGGLKCYRASQADQAAWDRAQRPKPCKLVTNRALAGIVAKKLRRFWSPEQIAGWLKCAYPNDESSQVSHETIYKSLFIQARGALKKELLQHLRSKRAIRRSRHASLKGAGLGKITNTVSIRERPASVEDRAVPGHWEGDLIFGTNNSQIATLVERHTRYVMLARVSGKDTETVINALIKQAHKLPRELYGSNENTNGLLRQYFPKGTDLSVHSQAKLNAVARQLNERPRKTLGFQTPAERFNACVASIG